MSSRRARVLRLRCECGRNVADVTADTAGSLIVTHRAKLAAGIEMPGDPGYAWRCRCGREHRKRHSRLVPAYAAVPEGRVEYRTLGLDL